MHEKTGKPLYRVKNLNDGIVANDLYDEYDLYPVQGLKNGDVVRVYLASNNSYRRMFGCIVKNRFARWTTGLYTIDFVTLGQRPPQRAPQETDEAYEARFDAWARSVVPLYQKYSVERPETGENSEEYQQQVQKILHNQYLVQEGAVPVDAVTLYFVKLLPGEKEERDEWLRWRPLSDEELLYVGEGNTPQALHLTLERIRRIKTVEHDDRKVLDFGYFKKMMKGQGGKRLHVGPRDMPKLMEVFGNIDELNAALDRENQEAQEITGLTPAQITERFSVAARTRSKRPHE